jgi:thymidine phosphorylase
MKSSELKQILNSSLINPRAKDLSLSIKLILEVDNPEYWLQRAVELLREVQEIIKAGKGMKIKAELYEENLSLATTLLTLCRHKNNEKNPGREKKTRVDNTGKNNPVSKGS